MPSVLVADTLTALSDSVVLTADTLVCDTACLSGWQNHPDYAYNRELMTPEVNLMEIIDRWMTEMLRKIFGHRFAEQYTEVVLAVLVVLILLAILWFLYRKRPELFQRTRRTRLAYSLHEDTIYGVDFGQEIAASLQRTDYREAMRLLYLQTLKQLTDNEQIDWQPYKTPTEYTYELKKEAIRPPFCQLTNSFLRVRYGNFEATEALFDDMEQMQQTILKPEGGLP